jgi:mannose-6-phosphate isomerase
MKLATQIVEKPWGRRDISAAFGLATFGDFDGRQIGEIWYDAPDGKSLPLLVKWLFTSEKLSVQVHPSDEQAQARGLASGKEECWYIVDAQPGAVLGMGTIKPLSEPELRAASLSGEIEELLDWKPVQAGDFFYIPAGTVHAIGAGVTLVEIQQNADITYRLYDYNRLDNGKLRELHLDDGIAVSQAKPYNDHRCGNVARDAQLVDEGKFNLWLVTSEDGLSSIPSDKQRWMTPLDGEVRIGEQVGRVGECLLAAAGESVTLSSDCRVLVACE